MFRQLLTILALVTGLAAVGAPVQAAQLGASVESIGQVEQGAPIRRAPIVLQLDGEMRKAPRQVSGCPDAAQPVVIPSVQIQADRAHE